MPRFLANEMEKKRKGIETYRSTRFVVVQIHLLAQIPSPFAGVDEFAGELEAVADVVGTTTPFPVPHGGWWSRLVGIVAGTRLDAALATRSRDAVSHSRAGDGVDEGGLSTTCNTMQKKKKALKLSFLNEIHGDNLTRRRDVYYLQFYTGLLFIGQRDS